MKNTARVPPPSELRRRVAEGRYRRVEPSGVAPRDDARSGHALPAGIAERFVRRMNEVWDSTWRETLDDVCEWETGAKAQDQPSLAGMPNDDQPQYRVPVPRSDVLVAGTMEPSLLGHWQEWCRANGVSAPMVAIGAPARADHIVIGAVACYEQPSPPIPQEIPPGWKWFEGVGGVVFFCSGSTKSVKQHPTTPGVWCAQREGGAREFTSLIDALMWCYEFRATHSGNCWFGPTACGVRWVETVARWESLDQNAHCTEHPTWWEAIAAALGKKPTVLGMV